MSLDKIQLKNAIRLLIGGWLFDEGDILEVPKILNEVSRDYKTEINKQNK